MSMTHRGLFKMVQTYVVTLRGTGGGRVVLVTGILLALLSAQSSLHSLEEDRVEVPVLSAGHLNNCRGCKEVCDP